MKSSILLLTATLCVLSPSHAEEPVSVLDTITVKRSRLPKDYAKSASPVSVLTSKDLDTQGFQTLGPALASLPGIHFAQSGPTGSVNSLVMRGATQKYMLIRVDGVNVSDPSASQIAPEVEHLLLGNVERIEVIRGSQSSLYGGQAVAGVIEITTKKAEPGLRHTLGLEAGSFGTFRGQASSSLSGEKGDIRVYADHLESEGFSAADENAGNSEKDGYRNTSVGATGRHSLTDQLLFTGSVAYTDRLIEFDGFQFGVGPADEDTNETTGEHLRIGTGLQFLDDQQKKVHDLTLSYYETDRDTVGEFPATFTGKRMEADYLGNGQIGEAFDLLYGASVMEESSETGSGLDEKNDIIGAFIQVGFSPVEPLYLTLTGRNDEHSEFGSQGTWRATAAFTPAEQTKIRSSVGTGFRAPSLFELFDSQLGNPDLSPENSTSVDVGIDHQFADNSGLVSLTWFALETDDQIEYVFPTGFSQVPGKSERSGIEASLLFSVTEQLQAHVSYTYMIEAENADGDPLLRVPEHDLSAGVTYTVGDWGLNALVTYVAGVEDLAYAFDAPPVQELDAYTVVNLGAAYQVNERVSCYVRVVNLFDEEYQQVRGYGTADRSAYAGVRCSL